MKIYENEGHYFIYLWSDDVSDLFLSKHNNKIRLLEKMKGDLTRSEYETSFDKLDWTENNKRQCVKILFRRDNG